MASRGRPSNSKAPDAIRYTGIDHSGPASIYRSAIRQPAVSLGTFSTRFRRLLVGNALSAANIDESLWLSTDEYKLKYRTRRTLIEVDGQPTDLLAYYAAKPPETAVDYRNFWQRVRALTKSGKLSGSSLKDALTLPAAPWRSFYGGGRRKGFVYEGDEFPEHAGVYFHSVAALLRTVGKYDGRALIWSRLKSGWNLDHALAVPIAPASHRSGSIYRIIRRKTGAVYVGLTVTTIDQRWFFHVRSTAQGSTTKFHVAIRQDGRDGFDVEMLENSITDLALLAEREKYWVERLGALGPDGLNSAKAGGLGNPRGKPVRFGDETFRSIEEAAAVLSERLSIAQHVIRTRMQKGLLLPQADRVRRHSKHPEAGSNLFRRWLGMLKRHARVVADEWITDYDKFKADVSPIRADMELVRTRPAEPWGPGNVEWVTIQTKVERTHGKALMVNAVRYASIDAAAKAHGMGVSTLKNRVKQQGMSFEKAIAVPLAPTSYKQTGELIMADGREFRSKRQAILHIAKTRGITEHQAKYRFSTGVY